MPSLARAAHQALTALLAVSALAVILVVAIGGWSSRTEANAGEYASFPGPGQGWIQVPEGGYSNLDPGSAITIEAWVFLTSYVPWGPGGSCPTVAGKGYQTSYWLGVCGPIRFYPKGNVGSFNGDGTVSLDQWTHVAVTYDGTTTHSYINGVLDGTSTAFSGAIPANANDLRIGSDLDWPNSPRGALDEVRIWNVARTQAQIQSTMNGMTFPQTGLIVAYNMEGNGHEAFGIDIFDGTPIGDITFSSDLLGSETPSPTPLETDTPAPTASPTPAPGAFQKGDVNCDGQLNAEDIMPFLRFSAGVGPFPAPCEASPAAAPQGGLFGQWLNLGASTGGYVSIPDDPALNPTGAITIEMLVNPYSYATAGGTAFCQSLVGKGFTTSYWLGLCYGHLRFYPRGSGSAQDSAGILPLRQWTHVAVVADATTLTFYINGVLDHQFTNASAPLTTDTSPVYIASDIAYNRRPWAAIDEVRIWNVARSQSDIQSTMGAPIVPPQTGLVAAYQFEGNTDDATGAHNGTAVGTLDIGNNLPPVNWDDIDCDGYTNLPGDWLAVLFHAAGLTLTLPPGCEPLGTAES